MMLRVKKPQDLAAGILFILFGIAGLWFGRNYAVGTAARMGPGYFPMMLSWLLIAFGGFIAARSCVIEGRRIDVIRWRSVFAIMAAIAAFALMIQRFGLALATVVVIGIAAAAICQSRWREVIPLALAMAAFCVGVFIYGLHQPLPLWGPD
jgi:hypothetical protein